MLWRQLALVNISVTLDKSLNLSVLYSPYLQNERHQYLSQKVVVRIKYISICKELKRVPGT